MLVVKNSDPPNTHTHTLRHRTDLYTLKILQVQNVLRVANIDTKWRQTHDSISP